MIISEQKKRILGSACLAGIIRTVLNSEHEVDQGREHFWVIGVNNKHIVQFIELVSLGSLTASIVHPREVFRLAIMKGVAAILLCHNHPSGDPSPSQEDRLLTKRLNDCADILGINILDHVILGESSYFSFRDQDGGLKTAVERKSGGIVQMEPRIVVKPSKDRTTQEIDADGKELLKNIIVREALRARDFDLKYSAAAMAEHS